jgi:hypothetical protein
MLDTCHAVNFISHFVTTSKADFWTTIERGMWCMGKTSGCEAVDNKMKDFQHVDFQNHHIQLLIRSENLKLHHCTIQRRTANIFYDTLGPDKFVIFWDKDLFSMRPLR